MAPTRHQAHHRPTAVAIQQQGGYHALLFGTTGPMKRPMMELRSGARRGRNAGLAHAALSAPAEALACGLFPAARSLAPGGLGVAGAAAVLVVLRAVATRRVLRLRVSVVVVPADEFDASPDAVLRFAAQLARVRRSVRGWLDRRASAVRVRLQAGREGRLVYVLEVPARAEPLLRSALRSCEGLELRDTAETLDDPPPSAAGAVVVRADLDALTGL